MEVFNLRRSNHQLEVPSIEGPNNNEGTSNSQHGITLAKASTVARAFHHTKVLGFVGVFAHVRVSTWVADSKVVGPSTISRDLRLQRLNIRSATLAVRRGARRA